MYKTIVSAKTLATQIDNPDWVVFDCRFEIGDPQAGRRAYLEEHIPAARYVSLDADLSSPPTGSSGRHPLPDVDAIADKLAARGLSDRSQAVVYDDANGSIAARMWWTLRWLGHPAVAVLDGGFSAWLRGGLPTEQEASECERGNFKARANDNMWVSTADVEKSLADADTVLIDARARARFAGEQESVDKKGGHIPGSVSHPLTANLDNKGCFLSAEELRARHEPLHKATTIHTCGSGVTACHNILAMEIAGIGDSKLYVGSWSEWIRSSQRPTATGEG